MEIKFKTAAISIVLLGGFFAFTHSASAATEVGGLFDTDQFWVATASPYIIKKGVPNLNFDGVGMAGGATLTIDPGVVVKFEAGHAAWFRLGNHQSRRNRGSAHHLYLI